MLQLFLRYQNSVLIWGFFRQLAALDVAAAVADQDPKVNILFGHNVAVEEGVAGPQLVVCFVCLRESVFWHVNVAVVVVVEVSTAMKECETLNSLDELLSFDVENQFGWSAPQQQLQQQQLHHHNNNTIGATNVHNSGNGFCEISSSPDR